MSKIIKYVASCTYRTTLYCYQFSYDVLCEDICRWAGNNDVRNQRCCQCCNSNDIEDEFHFICVRQSFTNIRKKYIKKCYYIRPSVFKYLQLLQSNNRTKLIILCLFVKDSLKVRSTLINVRI